MVDGAFGRRVLGQRWKRVLGGFGLDRARGSGRGCRCCLTHGAAEFSHNLGSSPSPFRSATVFFLPVSVENMLLVLSHTYRGQGRAGSHRFNFGACPALFCISCALRFQVVEMYAIDSLLQRKPEAIADIWYAFIRDSQSGYSPII
jgi:hypothetical protein